MESHQLTDSENCYLEPENSNYDIASEVRHDSGIGSATTLGASNPTFTSQPEMESSFSDEQKLSTNKAYRPATMPTRPTNTGSSKELGLPPPPGSIWLPLSQSHSADGVIGSYPPFPASYVHPSMLHPSLASLNSAELTLEEQQLLLKYRQEKLMKNTNGLSVSPEGDGPNLYEELPGSLYKTHQQLSKLGQSPMDEKRPPHIPPISSMPAHSQASSLDTLNNQQNAKKENPLYECNDPVKATQHEMDQKDQSEYSIISKQKYRCYCVFLFLSVVLATAALVITLLTATGIVNMNVTQNGNSTGTPRSEALKYNQDNSSNSPFLSQVQQLETWVNELLSRVEGQNDVIGQLNVKVQDVESDRIALENSLNKTSMALSLLSHQKDQQHAEYNNSLLTVNQLVSDLTFVNSSLHQALDNVSKMAGPQGEIGPQGPKGFLDPSLCKYQPVSSRFEPGIGGLIRTVFVSDTNQEKIIAASCEWENFKSGVLQTENIQAEQYRYRCHCKDATISGELSCKMHAWRCQIPTS